MVIKLYTKSDLERCARLALRSENDTVETAVAEAVETVVAEAPEVYRLAQLEDAARSAALLALQGLGVAEAVSAAVAGVRS